MVKRKRKMIRIIFALLLFVGIVSNAYSAGFTGLIGLKKAEAWEQMISKYGKPAFENSDRGIWKQSDFAVIGLLLTNDVVVGDLLGDYWPDEKSAVDRINKLKSTILSNKEFALVEETEGVWRIKSTQYAYKLQLNALANGVYQTGISVMVLDLVGQQAAIKTFKDHVFTVKKNITNKREQLYPYQGKSIRGETYFEIHLSSTPEKFRYGYEAVKNPVGEGYLVTYTRWSSTTNPKKYCFSTWLVTGKKIQPAEILAASHGDNFEGITNSLWHQWKQFEAALPCE
jgi:hypothetical protein